jgi:competence protein ComEA
MKISHVLLSSLFAIGLATQVFAGTLPEQGASPSSGISAHIQTTPHRSKSKVADTQVININTANAEDLVTLKGIGAKKAEAIVAYRTQHGNFKTVDELSNVKGINAKTIQNNHDRLSVG